MIGGYSQMLLGVSAKMELAVVKSLPGDPADEANRDDQNESDQKINKEIGKKTEFVEILCPRVAGSG
jgi:hypothetical protein